MALNSVKMDVDVDIKISDSTAEKCLRILELWQNDHPDKEIIGTKKQTEDGIRTEFCINNRSVCERCNIRNTGYCDPFNCRYTAEKEKEKDAGNENSVHPD